MKLFFVLSLMMLLTAPLYAQRKIKKMDDDKQQKEDDVTNYSDQPWKEKIKFGGGISAVFGSGYSYFFFQPFVAYQVNKHLLPGAGVTYIYWSQIFQTNSGQVPISDNAFGFNFFAKEQIAGPISIYAEYSPINFTSYNYFGEKKRVWGQQFFVGGGLYQQHSYFIVLYDLLWKSYDVNGGNPANFSTTFRSSPLDLRVGFIF